MIKKIKKISILIFAFTCFGLKLNCVPSQKPGKKALNKALGGCYLGLSWMTSVIALTTKLQDTVFDSDRCRYRSKLEVFKKLMTGTLTDLCTARALYYTGSKLLGNNQESDPVHKKKKSLNNVAMGILDKLAINYGAISYAFDYPKKTLWTRNSDNSYSIRDKKSLVLNSFISFGLIYAAYKSMRDTKL